MTGDRDNPELLIALFLQLAPGARGVPPSAIVSSLCMNDNVVSILTPEQEALIDEQMAADGSFAFSADDIAEDLGIPPMSERDWTDEEIDRVWNEYVERRRPWFIAQLLYPDVSQLARLLF